MKCYKCGAEVSGGKMSCDKCGAMIFSNIEERKDVSNLKWVRSGGIGLSVVSMIFGIVSWICFIVSGLLTRNHENFALVFMMLMVACATIGMFFGVYSLSTNRKGKGMAIVSFISGIILFAYITFCFWTYFLCYEDDEKILEESGYYEDFLQMK